MQEGPGRPTVIDKEAIRILEDAFSVGASDEMACFLAKVSTSTFYDYQKKTEGFSERKAQLKNKLKYQTRKNISKFLLEGDKDMTKWYGEKKMSDEFKDKKELDVSIKNIEELPDEELDKLLDN
jgi:hypothetical protein